jgi:putative copper export protein
LRAFCLAVTHAAAQRQGISRQVESAVHVKKTSCWQGCVVSYLREAAHKKPAEVGARQPHHGNLDAVHIVAQQGSTMELSFYDDS